MRRRLALVSALCVSLLIVWLTGLTVCCPDVSIVRLSSWRKVLGSLVLLLCRLSWCLLVSVSMCTCTWPLASALAPLM